MVDARVANVVARHERSLMRVARQWSLCRDDALDAYQRALEIYVRRIDAVDPVTEISWLRVVVKHEALAVRRMRAESVTVEDVDLDGHAPEAQRPVDELLAARERVSRGAEALRRLKPDEAKALMLKAEGHSYKEISEQLGWTYTKTNRAITEGRARFLKAFAAIEAGAECERSPRPSPPWSAAPQPPTPSWSSGRTSSTARPAARPSAASTSPASVAWRRSGRFPRCRPAPLGPGPSRRIRRSDDGGAATRASHRGRGPDRALAGGRHPGSARGGSPHRAAEPIRARPPRTTLRPEGPPLPVVASPSRQRRRDHRSDRLREQRRRPHRDGRRDHRPVPQRGRRRDRLRRERSGPQPLLHSDA